MINSFRKLLKGMFSKKYPMYLDIHVTKIQGMKARTFEPVDCYDVFLIILEEDYRPDRSEEVRGFIHNLAKYLDISVCGIHNEILDREEWEEIRSQGEG